MNKKKDIEIFDKSYSQSYFYDIIIGEFLWTHFNQHIIFGKSMLKITCKLRLKGSI